MKTKAFHQEWMVVVISGSTTILVCLLILLALIPAVSPSTGALVADSLRAIFGPGPVGMLESVSFQLQDTFNQARSQLDGGGAQISLSSPQPTAIAITAPPPTQTPVVIQNTAVPEATPVVPATPTAIPTRDILVDAPQIGWQSYGPSENGVPIMANTLIKLDPSRSYSAVALVRIDLSRLQLHLMAGYLEPAHPSQISILIPELGKVPSVDQSHLIAAFNGGFKGINGRYGMMVNGFPLLPPQDGLGTVAIYRDGHVQMGSWGLDIFPTADMIAFRQNCPPLIDAGQINPALYLNNRKAWGYTGNTDITWRTGLGITQDGRYLIYAVGNGSSAAVLADALQQAGAYMAMQLDINQFYAHFNTYTYQPSSDPAATGGFQLTGDRLVAEMINNPHLYLTPNPRDFFYLTLP